MRCKFANFNILVWKILCRLLENAAKRAYEPSNDKQI